MNINDIIASILSLKSGDKAFILCCENSNCESPTWTAAVGNRSPHVCLGENLAYDSAGADFVAEAQTPEEALTLLLDKVESR